ncbi:MAG: DUF4188 domain-containing protein [Chloroflexota bacterium]
MTSLLHRRTEVMVPEEGVVLFLVGMRINQVWRVRQWMPVIGAMRRMMTELAMHPELGVLGASMTFVSGRRIQVQQYWRSLDDLHAYARSREHAHLPAWGAFYRRAKGTQAVGVYHEVYAVPSRGGEALYVNTPVFGLAEVVGNLPAAESGGDGTVRDRDVMAHHA